MSKTITLIAFIGMCLVQLVLPASTVWQMEDVVKTGETHRFRCAPVDPTDPFRGKYLTLNFADTVAVGDLDLAFQVNAWDRSMVYAIIDPTFTDFVRLKSIQQSKPSADIPFLKANVRDFINDSIAVVSYDFSRFYIEEDEAKLAETLYNEASRNQKNTTYAVVKIADGTAVLQDILINEKSIRDLVKEAQ